MQKGFFKSLIPVICLGCLILSGCTTAIEGVERPEKILSKRKVVYDRETYTNLAELWMKYNDTFPSEDAYANWMYAARYAGDPDYSSLLNRGLKKYPSNPTVLYLAGLEKHGCEGNIEGRLLLEKSAELDPAYDDPWYALAANYMTEGEFEQFDVALRRLLELGAIQEDVMDYNYNMLASLEKDAILITNGDNDTYPGWILTRILKYRPDVRIVNRSLLNTDWYPIKLIEKDGLPNFITSNGLGYLREGILALMKKEKNKIPPSGPFGDTLIVRIIDTAEKVDRPVYFAATLYSTDTIDRYLEKGKCFGLVTLVTESDKSHEKQIMTQIDVWLNEFRTGGLDSWGLKYSDEGENRRRMSANYAFGMLQMMDDIAKFNPASRGKMFKWYIEHIEELIPPKYSEKVNAEWCKIEGVREIEEWRRQKGL